MDAYHVYIEMGGAASDFIKNYSDMRTANWKGSDKYFHAKANFQATQRGPGGKFFAEHFSNLREIWDQNVKGYPRLDSRLDQLANRYGRDKAATFSPDAFREALKVYRPLTLPSKY
jgi:serum amyloid A protein